MTHLFGLDPTLVQTHHRRPFAVRFAGEEDQGAGGGGGGETKDEGGDEDAGFVYESHSVAPEMSPADTTEESASAAGVNETEGAEGRTDDKGETRTRDTATGKFTPAEKAAKGPKEKVAAPGKKGQEELGKRVQDLRRDVDSLTFSKHRAKEEADREETRLTTLRAEATALEAKLKRGDTTVEPGTKAGDKEKSGASTDDPMPKHPKFSDYETDAEYEAAVAKWSDEEMPGWDARRLNRMKQEIQDGVDAKMSTRDGERRAEQVTGRMAQTLSAVREEKADWGEKAEALREIRSSWVSEEAMKEHGPTPFLTDLSKSLLADGYKEGAELLYWLGSDAERATKVAELLPSRAMRDAIVANPPSVIPLLEHFATDDGRTEFETLKRMHPTQAMTSLGALILRIASASSGSDTIRRSVTGARPAARPQVGTVRAEGKGGKAAPATDFESWMTDEDGLDEARRREALGLT